MISFVLSVILLVGGYFLYGKFVERCFGPDNDRLPPAITINDGVDFVPMPTWKVFLIQLLNIAGTGPIFGALSGALFGPIVYLWIVAGCIFAGGVHDYMCGMLSIRNQGASVSELTGKYLGNGMRRVMRFFSVILLIMCGVVFTTGPADLLAMITPENLSRDFWFWMIVIYYFIATFLPIDKVIGRLYPLFGVCLIVMAIAISGTMLFSGKYHMPEIWNHFAGEHPQGIAAWPFMFITVACGAISGFHATQSPIMARCLKKEKDGRTVFYGSMIAEGLIALVWAAAGVTVYETRQALLDAGAGSSKVVYDISTTMLGGIGSILALIGVIVCPISSGDTAYRSARLTLAECFHLDQSSRTKRLLLTVPLLLSGVLICQVDYQVIWRYFSWSNQTLAMIVLWTASFCMAREGKSYQITMIPAVFMTAVSVTYFVVSPECLGLMWNALQVPYSIYYRVSAWIGFVSALAAMLIFVRYVHGIRKMPS